METNDDGKNALSAVVAIKPDFDLFSIVAGLAPASARQARAVKASAADLHLLENVPRNANGKPTRQLALDVPCAEWWRFRRAVGAGFPGSAQWACTQTGRYFAPRFDIGVQAVVNVRRSNRRVAQCHRHLVQRIHNIADCPNAGNGCALMLIGADAAIGGQFSAELRIKFRARTRNPSPDTSRQSVFPSHSSILRRSNCRPRSRLSTHSAGQFDAREAQCGGGFLRTRNLVGTEQRQVFGISAQEKRLVKHAAPPVRKWPPAYQ